MRTTVYPAGRAPWRAAAAALLVAVAAASAARADVEIRPVLAATCDGAAASLPPASGSADAWAARAAELGAARFVIDAAGSVAEIARPEAGDAAITIVALVNPPAGRDFPDEQMVALVLLVDELRALEGGASRVPRAVWGEGACARRSDAVAAFDWSAFVDRLARIAP
ncbi:MAG: hypothetical protein R3E88_14470 [Myxococcota bacterium]